jgi:hypothetical protein
MEDKNIKKKLINKLKSNFCMFPCTNPNYELVAYNVQQQHVKQFNKRDGEEIDNLDVILTPKFKTRSRLPIYYKTPIIQNDTFELNSVMKPNNNNYDDVASSSSLSSEVFHSTTIDDDKTKSPSLSQYPYLMITPDGYNNKNRTYIKTSNTLLKKILTDQNHHSPNTSPIQRQLYTSSIDSSNEEEEEEDECAIEKKNLFEIGSIYSCCIPYSAKYDGDLTIKFAERVQIVKDDGISYILVKNLSTKAFGYVPRDFILPVNRFLSNLV